MPLQRNSFISALSQTTVDRLAGWCSGSLNTAGHAADLWGLPSPITRAASAGCHRLIRDFDAVCVTNADEMAELMPHSSVSPTAHGGHSAGEASGQPADQLRVTDALSARSARPVDDIAARAGLSIAQVQSALGCLQIDGIAAERVAGWVKATRHPA